MADYFVGGCDLLQCSPAHLMAEIGRGTLNPRIPPGAVFARQFRDQFRHFTLGSWPPGLRRRLESYFWTTNRRCEAKALTDSSPHKRNASFDSPAAIAIAKPTKKTRRVFTNSNIWTLRQSSRAHGLGKYRGFGSGRHKRPAYLTLKPTNEACRAVYKTVYKR
jgi:hypothetical protein